jgi:hypothetical protein
MHIRLQRAWPAWPGSNGVITRRISRIVSAEKRKAKESGVVGLLALLLWRVMERAMRMHVDTTSMPLPGWDKKATERPTSFMMVTKFAGVIVLKLGHHRQLARPLSGVQHQYLTALDVPATCFTLPAG